jgi:mannose-6-phosphate isomerase
VSLYPLKFEPLYQYRTWGGRRLATLLGAALPGFGPIGESWLLSDRTDHASVVANGALKGQTLRQLWSRCREELLGDRVSRAEHFPLLLKFLDVRGALSVQVHPSDWQTAYLPPGESGKTEAWVVLDTGIERRIYAGLTPQATPAILRQALTSGSVAEHLESFTPATGDAVLVPAGVVHSLRDVVVFEVQENSDVTFRLYDWNQMDAVTHEPRLLQIEAAMACIDFSQGAIGAAVPEIITPAPLLRERLVECDQFTLWRLRSTSAFTVGVAGTMRVLVCIAGLGCVRHDGIDYALRTGEVLLLPAVVGACVCTPDHCITLLDIAVPDG